jgi:hypothetical protein
MEDASKKIMMSARKTQQEHGLEEGSREREERECTGKNQPSPPKHEAERGSTKRKR